MLLLSKHHLLLLHQRLLNLRREVRPRRHAEHGGIKLGRSGSRVRRPLLVPLLCVRAGASRQGKSGLGSRAAGARCYRLVLVLVLVLPLELELVLLLLLLLCMHVGSSR